MTTNIHIILVLEWLMTDAGDGNTESCFMYQTVILWGVLSRDTRPSDFFPSPISPSTSLLRFLCPCSSIFFFFLSWHTSDSLLNLLLLLLSLRIFLNSSHLSIHTHWWPCARAKALYHCKDFLSLYFLRSYKLRNTTKLICFPLSNPRSLI